MTFDLNDDYGVTISSDGKIGSAHRATGEIFDRETMQDVGISVSGEGRTWSSASSRALTDARIKCPPAKRDR